MLFSDWFRFFPGNSNLKLRKFNIQVAIHYFTQLLTSNLKFAHSLVLDSGSIDINVYTAQLL